MINSERIGHYLFNPLWPILLYIFMAITTLHEQIPILKSIHIETLVLGIALVLSAMHFLLHERKRITYNNPILMSLLLGLLFILTPIISSLINQDQLAILQDEEYKTLVKMILFAPCLFLLMKDKNDKEIVLNSIIFFYAVFALYFLYRFLILHEVRDFDQRPQLNIRHGDANFLCTFFSMMIPLPLMQAWNSSLKKENNKAILFGFVALLLMTCTILTESRMGLIATLFGLLYLVTRPVLSIPKTYVLGTILIIASVSTFTMDDHLLSRFSEMQDKSNTDRYLTWTNGAQLFFENPIVGTGMHKAKNFYYQNTGYPHFQSEFQPLEIHNTFLKVAAELGLIGLLFFAFLFLWPWKLSIQSASHDRFFLISSLGILTLSIMTIGIVYKDLFVLHLFLIASLAIFFKPSHKAI